MKVLFLDFDGVLHTMSEGRYQPFNRLPILEPLAARARFNIVLSSSWRIHRDLADLKSKLGALSPLVSGVTGEAVVGKHSRHQEILQYVSLHGVRDWRALDDARFEFPEALPELILCDPRLGVTEREVALLESWLGI